MDLDGVVVRARVEKLAARERQSRALRLDVGCRLNKMKIPGCRDSSSEFARRRDG